MERTYKLRIYPNKQQIRQMDVTFNATRFVYNYFLTKQIQGYKDGKPHMFYYSMSKELPILKKEYEWLKKADAVALQQALRNLDEAYHNYFREMKKIGYIRYSPEKLNHFKEIGHTPTLYDSAWHPKFKKKSNHRHSYTTQNYKAGNDWSTIMINENRIRFPKLGWVKYRDNREIKGRILNATIEKTPSCEFYAYVCCSDIEIDNLPKQDKMIGIDLGMKDYICSYSDGTKEPNPTFFKFMQIKIDKLQKELDRKNVGGANWEKSRIKLAKAYEKLTNQKMDYLQKLTSKIVENYDVICVEDLAVQDMIMHIDITSKDERAMIRNGMYSCSWGTFLRLLEYKAKWYGKELYKVDRFFPSSQLCSVCGYKETSLKDKKIREWDCPCCGVHHDRDVNAAINILNEGLKQRK